MEWQQQFNYFNSFDHQIN